MNRKSFIKSCCYAGLGVAASSVMFSGCTATSYFANSTVSADRIAILKSEFIVVKKDKSLLRKYVLVKTDKLNFPICIYKNNGNDYTALLLECTHKSCELVPQGDYLLCPCHGSEFTRQGIVQNPPAEQNLQLFKVSTDDETIYIHL